MAMATLLVYMHSLLVADASGLGDLERCFSQASILSSSMRLSDRPNALRRLVALLLLDRLGPKAEDCRWPWWNMQR